MCICIYEYEIKCLPIIYFFCVAVEQLFLVKENKSGRHCTISCNKNNTLCLLSSRRVSHLMLVCFAGIPKV